MRLSKRLSKKLFKFFLALLSIFLASLAAFAGQQKRTRVEDEERDDEEQAEQEELNFLLSKKRR